MISFGHSMIPSLNWSNNCCDSDCPGFDSFDMLFCKNYIYKSTMS